MENSQNIKFKENWIKLPANKKLQIKARDLRKAGNMTEVIFWNHVKQGQIYGLDFDRQKVISNYIVDFYIKKLGLIIEIDGSTHTDSKFIYDRKRENLLRSFGLSILRYQDKDVKNNIYGVVSNLKAYIVENFIEQV